MPVNKTSMPSAANRPRSSTSSAITTSGRSIIAIVQVRFEPAILVEVGGPVG
jgi:hypothetical protein